MNGLSRDDIIRMAREAGGLIDEVDWYFEYENLERFANLVAAAEREACAECADGYDSMIAGLIRARGSDAA